jgi:hypothetical protein
MPDTLQGVLHQHNRFFQFPANLADIALLQVECDYFRVELQHDEVVSDFVVKILCETAPLFLVRLPQLDRKISQALVRPAVSFLQRLAL